MCVCVVAVTFQNISYSTEFHRLITPHSSIEQRRQAAEPTAPWGPTQAARLDLHYFLGASLLDIGNYSGAARELKQVVDADPSQAVAWAQLGRATAGMGELANADEYFRRAISLYPPGRRPRVLYREFLASHPTPNGSDSPPTTTASAFDDGGRLLSPAQVLEAMCDPFQLIS